MGKIMEAVFCVFYLIFTMIIGIKTVTKSKGNRAFTVFGYMTIILVCGDSFHLVPRIFAAINQSGDYGFWLGIGKLITSITMTVFYFLMYCFYEIHFQKKSLVLRIVMAMLMVIRIALCLFPQNDWTGAAPVTWGIYRNIPFTIMGLLVIVLFFINRKDDIFRWMWLAVALSFIFYLPVVLWADVHPMIGMLMLPKTCMYIWIVMMGYKGTKSLVQK
ncbi:MAG: hypothetical protein MJ188_00995 [Treponema sp.]|nr:hypothetical protein [Treponema sp.]